MIGKSSERGSVIHVLAARHDDDDDPCKVVLSSEGSNGYH